MAASLALAADPFIGTWKSDPSKAKPSPGSASFRSDGIMTWNAVTKDHYQESWTSKNGQPAVTPTGEPARVVDIYLDGKDHGAGGNGVVSIAVRTDERHVRMTVRGPKGTTVTDDVVSADGKTLTVTRKGTGANNGRVLDEVFVFTKQ